MRREPDCRNIFSFNQIDSISGLFPKSAENGLLAQKLFVLPKKLHSCLKNTNSPNLHGCHPDAQRKDLQLHSLATACPSGGEGQDADLHEGSYFTYIMASRSRTLYAGVTGNLENLRLQTQRLARLRARRLPQSAGSKATADPSAARQDDNGCEGEPCPINPPILAKPPQELKTALI
jgi:hypothetical protein